MKKSTVILIWGCATGIGSIIFYQILYATGQENSSLKWLNLLVLFLGIFVGTMQYRNKANEGYLTFGEGFKAGLLMALIITVLTTIATVVDLQLHPDMIDKIIAQARDSMINKGMTEEQIAAGMKVTKLFTSVPIMILLGILGGLFWGVILSLITAALCGKNKPLFDDVNDQMPGNETTQL